VQKTAKKQNKRQKRTQYMCHQMLRWIRLQMLFEPRDMRAAIVPPGTKPMSRRTYQDYEAGKRGIPADLAARIREMHKRDREFMATIGDRIDAAERGEE
jgi:hypothetical protein